MQESYGVAPNQKRYLQTGLTASTGSTQATGVDLLEGYNEIATCANAGDSATLPPAVKGMEVIVFNRGAEACDVFPAVGDNHGAGANTAISLPPGEQFTFFGRSTSAWDSFHNPRTGGAVGDGQFDITANVGSTQATGEPLYAGINEIGVCATAGDSVTLPSAVAGMQVVVINNGAASADVFPAVGDNVGGGVNAAVAVTAGSVRTFIAYDATNWTTYGEYITPVAADQAGVTANVGSTQATGEAILLGMNEISTCANYGDAMTAPAALLGSEFTVVNNGAEAADIFPATGDNFAGYASDAAISLPPGASMTFHAYDGTEWVRTAHEPQEQFDLTANVGSTQGTGEPLWEGYNEIGTCATAGDSVTLCPAHMGMEVTVANNGATAADVFPASGETIEDIAADGAFSLSPGARVTWKCEDTGFWSKVSETEQMQYGITANVGSDQSSGEPLYPGMNEIATCANAGDSVTMPAARKGLTVRVINNGAQSCDVFPASGDNLGAGADTAVALAAGANIGYFAYDGTNWATLV